jgi:hypothetical protein
MKKVIVKNLEGIETHGAEMEDPASWIEEGVAQNWWGLPGDYELEVIDLDHDAEWILAQCYAKRVSEYPPASDWLDGLVKKDQAQMDKYIADCLAVKAKYPKP